MKQQPNSLPNDAIITLALTISYRMIWSCWCHVDYASFLQWEKTWNLYTISDNLDTLEEKQQTAILFSFFTKELLNDMEYRFKIDINGDQSVEEVLEQMKTYLKGQRSMILARYNLFTRRQQMSETFEEWYIELRRLYDLAEAEDFIYLH